MIQKSMTLAEITEVMSSIKHADAPADGPARGQVITNYYMNAPADACYSAVVSPRAIVFSYADGDLRRLFFYSTEPAELSQALMSPPGEPREPCEPCVIDCVAKSPPDFHDVLMSAGFVKHAVMQRYVQNDLPAAIENTTPAPSGNMAAREDHSGCGSLGRARPDESYELHALLHTVLDKYTGHFCSPSELADMIGSGLVLRERVNGEITAFVMYKTEGRKFYSYQIYSKYPGSGLRPLFCNAMKSCVERGIRRGYCWADVTNIRSIKFHARYGFTPDALYDYVYTRN